ncbi:hypothetical protein LINPERHAP1_LOCUS7850, partial [Linum perenne]
DSRQGTIFCGVGLSFPPFPTRRNSNLALSTLPT